MQDIDYFLYKKGKGIALYSPKVGNLKKTQSGRINLPRAYLFDTPSEAASFLFDECAKEDYRPNLIYGVPEEQKDKGRNLELRVLRQVTENIRSIHDKIAQEAKARIRQKVIVTRERKSSGERLIRIRSREKISI